MNFQETLREALARDPDRTMMDFKGRFFTINGVQFKPTPAQGDRVPIWIGARGVAPAPSRRAAKYADYWHPGEISPDEMREGGDRIDQMAGRPVKRTLRMQVDVGLKGVVDRIGAFREAGCVQVACEFSGYKSVSELKDVAARFLEQAKAL